MFWGQKAKDRELGATSAGRESEVQGQSVGSLGSIQRGGGSFADSSFTDGVSKPFLLTSTTTNQASRQLSNSLTSNALVDNPALPQPQASYEPMVANDSTGFVFGSRPVAANGGYSASDVLESVSSGASEASMPRVSRPYEVGGTAKSTRSLVAKDFVRDDLTRTPESQTRYNESDAGVLSQNEQRVSSSYNSAYKNYRVVVPEGTRMEGDLSFTVPVRLEGDFKGSLVSSDIVVIGRGSVVKGSIKARVVLVQGSVQGPVIASHSVLLHEGSVMRGKLSAPKFVMEEGAEFNGTSEMSFRPRRASL
jgi:cytoskeletal protein CcmA (bactofilin family)